MPLVYQGHNEGHERGMLKKLHDKLDLKGHLVGNGARIQCASEGSH